MSKLEILATAAAEFYGVAIEDLRSPCRKAIFTKPRHTCQWIADNAGIKRGVIARFWKVDHASVFYGCKIVAARIKGSGWERHELGLFSKIVTKLMEEDRLRRQAVEGRFLAIEK
jgi:chromosomal replication initiation ATPase DnaA